MPRCRVLFYLDGDGRSPVADWLKELRSMNTAAFAKCAAVIERLMEAGHELRRPTSAHLRDGIHELRARTGHVNHRILYFFHGRNVAVLAHALTKEDIVDPIDIQRAAVRKVLFERSPSRHTQQE